MIGIALILLLAILTTSIAILIFFLIAIVINSMIPENIEQIMNAAKILFLSHSSLSNLKFAGFFE